MGFYALATCLRPLNSQSAHLRPDRGSRPEGSLLSAVGAAAGDHKPGTLGILAVIPRILPASSLRQLRRDFLISKEGSRRQPCRSSTGQVGFCVPALRCRSSPPDGGKRVWPGLYTVLLQRASWAACDSWGFRSCDAIWVGRDGAVQQQTIRCTGRSTMFQRRSGRISGHQTGFSSRVISLIDVKLNMTSMVVERYQILS